MVYGNLVDAIIKIAKNNSPRTKSYIAICDTKFDVNIADRYSPGFCRSHHIKINQPNTIKIIA